MSDIITLHDCVDNNDPQGRTFKEMNMAKDHKFSIGQLVEIDLGVRLLVARHVRDCDGTPLYHLSAETPPEDSDLYRGDAFYTEQWEKRFIRNYPEEYLKEVK